MAVYIHDVAPGGAASSTASSRAFPTVIINNACDQQKQSRYSAFIIMSKALNRHSRESRGSYLHPVGMHAVAYRGLVVAAWGGYLAGCIRRRSLGEGSCRSLSLHRWRGNHVAHAFGRRRNNDSRWKLPQRDVEDSKVGQSVDVATSRSHVETTPEARLGMQHASALDDPLVANGPIRDAEDKLFLRALKGFAVGRGTALVDIGVNMGKCTPKEFAQQLARAKAAGVDNIVLTGCSLKGSEDAQRLSEMWSATAGMVHAEEHIGAAVRSPLLSGALPTLSFTAGVHPHSAKTCNVRTMDALCRLAEHSQCGAIGECGLDYDRMFSPRDVQLEWCRKQVELAVSLEMPLFLHERDRDASKGAPIGSARDLLQILQDCGAHPSRVCVHCFTGEEKQLRAYVDRGYCIGLTGFVGMAKRGRHIRELLAQNAVPSDRLMIETDSPYMSPDKSYLPSSIGMHGRRNEPCAMPAVCRAVAEAMNVAPEVIARSTSETAKNFFML